jgi:fibro-slime domain-containing protein/choice-of-anchor A domain-containing protein
MKSLLVLALVGVALVYATNPTSITLQTLVRDFTPAHPDFEHYCCGDSRNAVGDTLDQDGKPFLQTVDPNFFTSVARYAQWYRDTPGLDGNIAIGPLTIVLDEIAPGLYSYNNQMYFPIDNQGFGNYLNYGHNFHFTTEIHTVFTYQGGEVFTFIGDDDVYVFINGHKAIDLGGVHGPETLSVNLDSVAAALGITVGGNYNLDVFQAERHTTGSTFRMDTSIQLVSVPVNVAPTTVYICGVAFSGFGANVDPSTLPKDPFFYTFGTGAADSFSNFNVISFGDFNANTGDTQGRVATRNNFIVGNGYSVGYEIHSGDASAPDIVCPYSLVAGRDATWGSGSLYPLGNNIPYNAPEEFAFVGGVFNAPSYLQSVRTGSCAATGCLDSDFDNAQAWYALLSSELAAVADNAQATFNDGHGVSFTCTDSTAASYYVTFTSSVFSSILSYSAPDATCNPAASWVINVVLDQSGSGDVTVQGSGQQFQAGAEYVLYNFPGYSLGHVTRNINTINGGVEGSILAPFANLNNQQGMDHGIIIVGSVVASDQFNRLKCPPPATPPTPPNNGNLCPFFESDCEGLSFPLKNTVASFRDFNVVSFGDWNANTGDIQGRLAVRNNLNVGGGYSVGDQIQTGSGADNFVPYSVVVGANANWVSGAVYPEGNNIPYPGAEEDLFVGGTFTGEADLAARVLGSCNGNAGCLNANFDAAQQCYINYQSTLASVADNAVASISWDAIVFSCSDNSADSYSITIDASVLTQGTYYILDNCNFQATWVINVAGTGSVVFAGDNFPGVGSSIVYNILGSGRSVNVETEVNGNILAPQNVLNQTGGVVEGKVVVGTCVASLQVNKPACSNPPATSINTQSNAVVPKGSSHIAVNSPGGIQKGDSVSFGNQQFNVVSVSSNDIEINGQTNNQNGAGARVSAPIADGSLSRVPVADAASSPVAAGSALQACVALIAAVALLF